MAEQHEEVHAEEHVEEGHAEHGEGFVEGFMALVSDPAHWAFEFTGEVTTTLVAYPLIRLLVRLHDRKFHPTHKAEEA